MNAALHLERLSFGEIYEFSTVVFILLFGAWGLLRAPNDLLSIATFVGLGTAVAPFVAACFSVSVWIVIKLAA